MRRPGPCHLACLAALFLVLAAFLPISTNRAAKAAADPQADPSDAKKAPIFISDFELAAAPPPPAHPTHRTSQQKPVSAPSNRPADAVYSDTDPASVQARHVVDAFANTLLELFQKNGYNAKRLPEGASLPSGGVLLRGVFAEPDAKNRIRRAILGAGSTGPDFLLYVASFNLARQDQPLYLAASEQAPDPHYGPVISLNAYIPMVKYDLPKDPAAQDVQKICEQIVKQLTQLLVSNPNAVQR